MIHRKAKDDAQSEHLQKGRFQIRLKLPYLHKIRLILPFLIIGIA